MGDRYSKTDSGRAEIRARAHPLSRTARNLLFILDPSRDGSEWVGLVQGSSAADLQSLLDAGLIAASRPAGPAAGASARPAEPPLAAAPAAPPQAPPPPSSAETGVLSHAEMYALLPGLAKQHLGLIKGLRFALAIEKATDLPALQRVAHDLVSEVERSKGQAVAHSLKRALMMD